MHEFSFIRNIVCVHVTCTVMSHHVQVHAICEGLIIEERFEDEKLQYYRDNHHQQVKLINMNNCR